MCIIRLFISKKYVYIRDIARYSYSQNIADQLSVVRCSGQALAVRTLSSHSHSVVALTSWCIGVITLVSTRVMYPLHLDARANDPLVSLAAVGSGSSTLKYIYICP
jgi:hypothetical protein